jgi:calcineurin-like phosphoesterase
VFHTGQGQKVAVAVLLGQSGFRSIHADSPFTALQPLMEILHKETPFVLLDHHAQPTAEKLGLAEACRRLPEALRPTAIFGSHTRVQTADEKVDRGVASISDAGRTGVLNSVGGSNAEGRIREYLSGIPEWTREAYGGCVLEGLVVTADERGRALAVESLRIPAGNLAEPEKKDNEAKN